MAHSLRGLRRALALGAVVTSFVLALVFGARTAAAQAEGGTGEEPVAATPRGTLEVRVKDEEGTIFVDGKEVGRGSYRGELVPGKHLVRVTRAGYEPFEKAVAVAAADVRVETVLLRKAASGDVQAEKEEGDWTFDGLYGGLQLTALFQPTSSGNTLAIGCGATGASSCEGGVPVGGGIGLHLGYAFAPLGLELMVLGAGDVVEPSASFDGVAGSDINPLAASPAREEQFLIGRFGGGGALRGRVLVPISRFRVTAATGVGLVYRHLVMRRDGTAADGAESSMSDDGKGYFSPALSFEVAGQVRLGGWAALALGLNLWLEHAGSDVASEPQGDVVLVKEGQLPQPHATPSYQMASGTQLFLGPFLGMQFGP